MMEFQCIVLPRERSKIQALLNAWDMLDFGGPYRIEQKNRAQYAQAWIALADRIQ